MTRKPNVITDDTHRECLKCRAVFRSSGPGNRICGACASGQSVVTREPRRPMRQFEFGDIEEPEERDNSSQTGEAERIPYDAKFSLRTRWALAIEVVERALHKFKTGAENAERSLPPAVTKRIITAVRNGDVPEEIADMCTLSSALEKAGRLTEDVEEIYKAVHGVWHMRLMSAAAGRGN